MRLLPIVAMLASATAWASEIETRIPALDEPIELGATLNLPEEAVAAAVLLSVAGPSDRDLSLGPKRFFAELAHALASQGVATLRYDDRGVGDSGGDWQVTTFQRRAEDACAAMRHLERLVPAVKRRGYIGLSEGGGLALYASAECARAEFLVLLSTPLLPGRSVMEDQLEAALAAFGQLSGEQRASVGEDARELLDWVVSDDHEQAVVRLQELIAGPTGGLLVPPYHFVPRDIDGKVAFLRSDWYRSQVSYDVTRWLEAAAARTLAIYGSLDQVIRPADHLAQLTRHLPAAKGYIMIGLNHLLQEARTGSPLEYATLDGTIADRVAGDVAAWAAGR